MTPTPRTTPQQLKSALAVLAAVAETIREAGEVPSGHLYAGLMGKLSIDGYNSMIDRLKGAGLVKENGHHLLIWTGPQFEKAVA